MDSDSSNMAGILTPPSSGSISSKSSTSSAGRRRKYCSTRVIPSLQRHETMLFGSLQPVACQSQENAPMYFSEDEDVDMALASLSSSMNSSQESISFLEG